MTAIDKVISIARDEIGYLEKNSNSNLDSKTSNAGSGNYTKYWRDVYPSYQGQAWCACFVSWCFMQAFGLNAAKKMLKHWPYVYCPTLGDLFTKYANPKTGDIVVFYRNGRFSHTGIVTSVNGDKFSTVEGNTSGASGIVPNGGGVCAKSYYNSNLPGTKFCRPDYNLAGEDHVDNDFTATNTGYCTANNVNVRSEPGGSILTQVNNGNTFETNGELDGWVYVRVGGTVGYIKNDYVEYTQHKNTEDEWIKSNDGRWWYRHADGSYSKNAWESIGGIWYYFDENGWMVTGWIKKGNKWYYLKQSGHMAASETLIIGSEIFYFTGEGHMGVTNDRGALI